MNAVNWVLILFAHVGPMGDGNSNALTTAYFTTRPACEAAGRAAKNLASASTKVIEYVCVQQ